MPDTVTMAWALMAALEAMAATAPIAATVHTAATAPTAALTATVWLGSFLIHFFKENRQSGNLYYFF